MKVLAVYAVSPDSTCIPLPYFESAVQAGRNDPDTEPVYELFDLYRHLVRDPKATFCVRVGGCSMTGVGIESGDLLLVDCSIHAQNGDIVIAGLNGEMMVKTLETEFGITYLASQNGSYSRIEVGTQDTLDIIGVVLNSIRDLCPRIRRGSI